MEPSDTLHVLLGIAVLLPLISFFVILLLGPRIGKGGAYVATGAILGAAVLSFISLFFIWLPAHQPHDAAHHDTEHHVSATAIEQHSFRAQSPSDEHEKNEDGKEEHDGEHYKDHSTSGSDTNGDEPHSSDESASSYTGDYYLLGQFGKLRLTISYYIDSLTIVMFCMVTLIATCIHFYAIGYMHEELHDVTDHEVTMSNGDPLTRPGRYYRFFQYMSLFCFSMLGLVLAGNIAMVFVFWELVGICSYFLIGFYVERKSASNAANKAFIVNRVGDFGMIIGLMILWAGLGTFAFGDYDSDGDGHVEAGIFSQVRPAETAHQIRTPDGLVRLGAYKEVAEIVRLAGPDASHEEIEADIESAIPGWRNDDPNNHDAPRYGYILLVVGGIGIFCGCVGKSAQFPLHVWLPDAMEGPTPVSALVHSATMVAAGVYLVGRFFPVFAPEVLLTIASAGCITLFIAATIAITATDIKRVLAYSTISQLGYMMLALGLGGWVAGLMHLITHAFFKSLLFMCSGSVIHAVHTNEMPQMGGLLKKMPYTAITMLIGCLAIAGVGFPMILFGGKGIGLSGFYSKDKILEQAFSFMSTNHASAWTSVFFLVAAGGAAITSFYMFRMWFLTFLGKPRDQHRYDHAHESPKVMYVPLIVLAFFATTVAWTMFGFMPGHELNLENLIEYSRPAGTLVESHGVLTSLTWPDEHAGHAFALPVTMIATGTWIVGIGLAAAFYWLRYLDPADARKQFAPIYRLLVNKWWFDELYDWFFIRPFHIMARVFAAIDTRAIDPLIDSLAKAVRWFASAWELIVDRIVVDGLINLLASWTYSLGISLRTIQTGKLRQYVLFIVVGALALFLIISFFWSSSLAN